MSQQISLNTDIGEGFGSWQIADDEALLQLVTDANLACGAHASDPDIMRRTCEVAAERGITIGAQVGYFDLRGFGRRFIEMDPVSLTNDVLYQIGALSAFTAAAGIDIGYLKIHGALDHAAIARPDYALSIIDAARISNPAMPLVCQPGTPLARAAEEAGMTVIPEGYIDRAYTSDGLLVPRGTPGALVTDPAVCAQRAIQFATTGTVTTIDGVTIEVPARSVCIHSDSPGSVEIARAVRAALQESGLDLRPLG